jgi:hypothetical protein
MPDTGQPIDLKARRRGKPKTPRKPAKRVGRWPRLDRERIERELAEWREKAGIWLHPA